MEKFTPDVLDLHIGSLCRAIEAHKNQYHAEFVPGRLPFVATFDCSIESIERIARCINGDVHPELGDAPCSVCTNFNAKRDLFNTICARCGAWYQYHHPDSGMHEASGACADFESLPETLTCYCDKPAACCPSCHSTD